MISVCPTLKCFFFFNKGNTEGTNSSKKIVFDVCVFFVLHGFVSGLILWFWDNFWFADSRAE